MNKNLTNGRSRKKKENRNNCKDKNDPCQPCHNALCCLGWAKTGHKAKCDNWDYFKKNYASGPKKIIGAEILQAGGDGQ